MRYQQLIENKDYNLARKLFPTLSDMAQYLIRSWENANWHEGGLTGEFESNSRLAQEIYQASAPIRKQIQRREGDTITLFRGLDKTATPDRFRPSRVLYSWTSSERMARVFAGERLDKKEIKPITDQEIEAALDRYERKGFTTFRGGRKYKQDKKVPQYYGIYDRHGQLITDGDNLEKELRWIQEYYDEVIENQKMDGRVVKKEIPVDDIVWVLMGGGSNEYIVRGHPE